MNFLQLTAALLIQIVMSVIGYSWTVFYLSKLDGRLRNAVPRDVNDFRFRPRVSPNKRLIEGTEGSTKRALNVRLARRFVNQSPHCAFISNYFNFRS